MEIKNAIIQTVNLTREDGHLDVWVTLDYGGSCQGFGGYTLYLPKCYGRHELKSVAGHFIYRVMEIAGVENWDSLVGKSVRARIDGGIINAIGHIIKDDWFCPSEDFTAPKTRMEVIL
jgi:hypothetical protein